MRLLRPLLGVAKAELLALLAAPRTAVDLGSEQQQPRLRTGAPARDRRDRNAGTDLAALHRLGLERQRLKTRRHPSWPRGCWCIRPGWAELALDAFPETASAGLAFGWVLQCLGGNDYPVSEERRLEALARIEAEGRCGFHPGRLSSRRHGARLEIHRDWGAIRIGFRRMLKPIPPEWRFLWDGRFDVAISPELSPNAGLTIARLGERGLRELGRLGHSRPVTASPNRHARRSRPCGRATGWFRRRT